MEVQLPAGRNISDEYSANTDYRIDSRVTTEHNASWDKNVNRHQLTLPRHRLSTFSDAGLTAWNSFLVDLCDLACKTGISYGY